MSDTEMVQAGGGDMAVAMSRPPDLVLKEAKKAAVALQSVILGKQKPVIFNGEQYIEFEDWQMVAKFYGVTAKVVNTTPVSFGNVQGFDARAVAIDTRTGIELSAADAMCLNDEDKWSSRTKYEYNESTKKREKVGEVAVPMFQLRSMAQTRACAKALRNIFAWVVVLAGYKPSVAEEMTGDEVHAGNGKPSLAMPVRKSEAVLPPPVQPTEPTQLANIAIKGVTRKSGIGKNGKEYTVYGIIGRDGSKFATFDKNLAEMADQAAASGELMEISYKTGQYGSEAMSLRLIGDVGDAQE